MERGDRLAQQERSCVHNNLHPCSERTQWRGEPSWLSFRSYGLFSGRSPFRRLLSSSPHSSSDNNRFRGTRLTCRLFPWRYGAGSLQEGGWKSDGKGGKRWQKECPGQRDPFYRQRYGKPPLRALFRAYRILALFIHLAILPNLDIMYILLFRVNFGGINIWQNSFSSTKRHASLSLMV